jgi:hypothetical protein
MHTRPTGGLRSRILRGLVAAGLTLLALDSATGIVSGTSSESGPLVGWDAASLGSINPQVFGLALAATGCAIRAGAVAIPTTLAVIDYSKPSTTPRLWVYDLTQRALVAEELVAHGQGSGDNIPTRFSNDPDSHASSLGLFVTEGTYVGKNGYSLRLNGLDTGFNDHAMTRAIVMHGASYVSQVVAKTIGRIGRSWGCPALSPQTAHRVIDRLKGGGLVFAYYPDQQWLSSSRYLGGCAAAR